MTDQPESPNMEKDVAIARIKHLSKEIETVTTNLMTFRSRIGFTVLVAPFIVMGSVLVATRGELVFPDLSFGLAGATLGAVVFYCVLGMWGAQYDWRVCCLCDYWRYSIEKLSREPYAEPDVIKLWRERDDSVEVCKEKKG